MEHLTYLEQNRALWNHWASLHPQSAFYNNASFIEHQQSLHSIERDVLPNLKGQERTAPAVPLRAGYDQPSDPRCNPRCRS